MTTVATKKKIRLIPRLDVKTSNVVKGIHLEGLRVVGRPNELAKAYYEQGADELLYMDIVASLYGRNSLLDIVAKSSKEVFVPLTVGGGIRSLEDIQKALHAGADKVAINTAATKNPKLISEAARRFGSQCVVISIEAKRTAPGQWEVYTDNGREKTGRDVMRWCEQVEELGAGEILVTSVDQEGTEKGFDFPLIEQINKMVKIPVVASGGAGSAEHLSKLWHATHLDGIAVASLLHYRKTTIEAIKNHLAGAGVPVRMNF